MHEIKNPSPEPLFFIAFNDGETGDQVHYSKLWSTNHMSTAKQNLETFLVESEWLARLEELGVDLDLD